MGQNVQGVPGYGAHIRASGAQAVARLAGVELRRVGQTNVLGRYPVHYHLMGDVAAAGGAPRASLSDCSIHQSYYRCVSIHGTHGVRVSQNVAYDAIGHCYCTRTAQRDSNSERGQLPPNTPPRRSL